MRDSILFALAVVLGCSTPARAGGEDPASQDPAAAFAARQEQAERMKRLNAKVEELEATNDLLRRRLTRQEEELRKLQAEVAKAQNQTAVEEKLRRLTASIEEVDKKRLDDYEKIKAEIINLGKVLMDRPVAGVILPSLTNTPTTQPTSDLGHEYRVVADDTLSGIVQKFRKEGILVTQKQVSDANPAVDWKRLKVGQKLFIPLPPKP